MRAWWTGLVAAVALLLVPAGAGAQTYGPHKVAEVLPFSVQTADGETLRGHVYLPDKPGPHATVLEYSPYYDGTANEAPNGQMPELLRHFTEAGFAVAFVSMRGTGASGGCLPLGGFEDRSDAYAVVEGLADQPWSNGRIGMWGLSYAGWSQFLAMAANPPSL